MKARRMFLIMSIMVVLVMLFLISSSMFELKQVEVKFYSYWGSPLPLSANKVYTTSNKVQEVVSSAHFEYGSPMFSINKDKYIIALEKNNPYVKALSLESVFPNKIVINAVERQEKYHIKCPQGYLIIDDEFKILDKRENLSETIPITFYHNNIEESFFDFFDISPLIFESGMFLYENNLVFQACQDFYSTVIYQDNNIYECISELSFNRDDNNEVSVSIYTKTPLGLTLSIQNIFVKFDYKLAKIMSAFQTLYTSDNIKTTYGHLIIDTSCNCLWNEN